MLRSIYRVAATVVVFVAMLLLEPVDAASGGLRCDGRGPTIVGTPGDDELRGTSGRDVIVALGGDDVVFARRGDDVVCGGGGDDLLVGGRGDDRMLGAGDADTLRGGRGHDSLFGHTPSGGGDPAVDALLGGRGADALDYADCFPEPFKCAYRDNGDDKIEGQRGRDVVGVCPDGQTAVAGGAGRDEVVFCAGVSADLSEGSATFIGDDHPPVTLAGFEDVSGAPNATDVLVGDRKANLLWPGYDGNTQAGVRDELRGGGGDDAILFSGADLADGGPGDDYAVASIPSSGASVVSLAGGEGRDRFFVCGGSSSSNLDGWHVEIDGGADADLLDFGLQATADLMSGTAVCEDYTLSVISIEELSGSAFADQLVGNAADNRLWGGRGDDEIDGGEGFDIIHAGEGDDVCRGGEKVRDCESTP